MRLLRFVLVALVTALSLVVIAPPAAYACSCRQVPVAQHVQEADLVVAGAVTKRATQGSTATYSIAVSRVYKGESGPKLMLDSEASGAACGIEVVKGDTYLFFAQQAGAVYTAGSCGGTSHNTAANELPLVKAVGIGVKPGEHVGTPTATPTPTPTAQPSVTTHTRTDAESQAPSVWWPWAVGGVALVAAGGLGWSRTRRRRS